jgi:hypothetical protein
MMRLRHIIFGLLSLLALLILAKSSYGHALDISSGGQPAITGAVFDRRIAKCED